MTNDTHYYLFLKIIVLNHYKILKLNGLLGIIGNYYKHT